MPRRSLLIEAFIAKELRKRSTGNDIPDDIVFDLLSCSALSLEFLQPYIRKGTRALLCSNSNIPWQYFEGHISEFGTDEWIMLSQNRGLPEEFFRRNLFLGIAEEVITEINESSLSDAFFAVASAIIKDFPESGGEDFGFETADVEILKEALKRDWARETHSLTELEEKLSTVQDLDAREQNAVLAGIARNPNLTVELIYKYREKYYDDFFLKVLRYNEHLPWSFLEENLDEFKRRNYHSSLALKLQISWDFLLQHPELISIGRDRKTPFRLDDLVRNPTITEEFMTKYLPDIERKKLLIYVAQNTGLTFTFFERHINLFRNPKFFYALCSNSSLPLLFFERHPEIADLRGFLANDFTYQFEIEDGLKEEELIYNAQVSLAEQQEETLDSLPQLMLGVMRDQHEKMVNRAYYR